MSVYKDAGHCIARCMSIETNDSTAKAGWQMLCESGWPELRGSSEMTAEDRLTQDCIARAILHKYMDAAAWHAIVAKYSINDAEVGQSLGWLMPRIVSPAPHLFKTKCASCWAAPTRLPASYYEIQSWDCNGTPDGTLRRWKSLTRKWLDERVTEAHLQVFSIMRLQGLIIAEDCNYQQRMLAC
jgi:hypothetical protein